MVHLRTTLGVAIALFAALAVACGSSSDDTPTPTASPEPTAAPEVTAQPTSEPTPDAAVCSFETATPAVFASVVQVVTPDSTGTGFAIGGGEFLTAAHVVADGGAVSLRTSSAEADAEIVGLELDTDIAILRSDIQGIEPVEFAELETLAAGQSVAVAGYPKFVEDDPSVVSGLLSKIVEDPDLGFGTFIQTDAAVNPGNSGGPMFNKCGEVVGMAVAKIVDTSIEGISWAVAENTLQSALPRVRRKGPPEPGSSVDPWFVEVEPEGRYIANTGGSGVSFRDDCLDSARLDGSWPEGAVVVLSHDGIGFCEGWSIVLDENAVSWVQDQYLATSPPAVVQPPPPQPTATTPPPTPTPTATPVLPPAEVVNFLVDAYNELLDFSAQSRLILESHTNGVITAEIASAQAYALQEAAYAASDEVLLPGNNLSQISTSCEATRQWLGDALFYQGLGAGYDGLAFEFWPNVSFDDAEQAIAQSFDSLDKAAVQLELCRTGS